MLEDGAEGVCGDFFAGGDEGDLALAEFRGDVGEGGGRVAVADAVGVAAGGEVHADAAGAQDIDAGIGDFEQKAGAVFDGAAVVVGAVVGGVLQELVEEVAVGAVDFDGVETGLLGVFGAEAEGGDDAWDFREFKGPGRDEGLLRAHVADVAAGRDGAGGNWELAVEVDGVGDAAHVPELEEHAAAGMVDGGGDGLPGGDLGLRPDAGDVGVADAHGIDGGGFGKDEAGGGTLGVVLGHDGRGEVVGRSRAGG